MALVGKWFGFAHEEVYDEGVRAFEQGDYEEATEAFGSCLQEASDPALIRLARHYLCECHLNSGHARMRDANFPAAAEDYNRAIALSPNYPDLHLSLARAYRGLGNRVRHLNEIEKALELNPNYVDAIIEKGLLFYGEGDRDAALRLIESTLSLDHGIDPETYRTALAQHREGKFGEAAKSLESLRTQGKSNANAEAKDAARHHRNGDLLPAKSAYERALAVAPDFADLHCKYGQVLLELGEVDEAVAQLKRAVEINERYVEALTYLGVALSRQGRDIEAGDCFTRALTQDPYHPLALAESAKLPARRSLR